MNQQTLDNQETISEKEIDLYDLVVALWKRRNVIILFSSIAAIISLMLALFWFSNVYTSTATLMPKTSSTSGVSLSRLGLPELGGLSNIIGASGSNDPNLNLAQKLITARGFIVDFVEKEDYLPEIMVSEDWDSSSNSIIYDKDGYDFEKDKLTFKPTDDDIYKNFVDRFFMVVDRETQFITIEFDHFSPYFAQEALFKLINEVNSEVRRREVDRTKKSIEYLNNQVEKTSSVDLKFLFNKLRESNIKNLMLAEIDEYFVLDIVDPPTLPSKKSFPRRAIICTFGTFFGFCLSLFFIATMRFFRYDISLTFRPLKLSFIALDKQI